MDVDILDILICLILIIIMYGLGCAMTWAEVQSIVKYKAAFLAGVVSQFGFMPFVGWSLSRIADLNTAEALGAIFVCSAPGGSLSNFFCYQCDGNLGLSIAMTVFSTLAAFGMMPFMIWVWADKVNGFEDEEDIGELDMDYVGQVVTLLICIVPALFGCFTRSTDWAKVETEICCYKTNKRMRWEWFSFISSATGAIFIVIALIAGILKYRKELFNDWRIVFTGALILPVGCIFGYGLATLLGLSHREAMTVSWETGLQNLALAIAIIDISFEDGGVPDKEDVLKIPLHAIILYYVEVMIIYWMFKWVNKRLVLKRQLKHLSKTYESPGFVA